VSRAASLRALVGLALVVAGCSDGDERPPFAASLGSRVEPIAGCEDFSYRACDIVDAGCQSELFELMRCAYGMGGEDAAMPPITLLTEAEALEWLSADAEPAAMADTLDFGASVRALEGLGMIERGMIVTEEDVAALTLENVLGLYVDAETGILIIDRGELTASLDANSTLGHELVHALQDQRHDLAAVSAGVGSSLDAQLGLASLVEGEAAFYELQMLLAYQGRTLSDVDFARLREIGDDLSLELGSPALTARSVFPYTYGAFYVADRWLEGGREALDEAYAHPPNDTLQIVQGSPSTLDPIAEVPAPLDGYLVVDQQSYGAWVLAATLAELADANADDYAAVASGWRGDQLSIYRANEGQGVAADWVIRARDAAAAERFAEAYRSWRPPTASVAVRVDAQTVHVIVSDGAGEAARWLERWGSAQ
jgi:hypothetical protein